ncbi:hypothetical protein C0Q70_15969 [Pomacea canaliculata]|uniref:Peptidase M12B propeptide domain-containing protein n=1 Tax=Pomacea canaliculata TaxID=400727 RepID=A0A2T7NNH9_POMCA|nr:hypothetical protein C0Q70_15969 [Pomacea canaliculata]
MLDTEHCLIWLVADESLSQVRHFQVVIPQLVDHRGTFLSYDVSQTGVLRHMTGNRRRGRQKRATDDSHVYLDGADQLGRNSVFYKLSAYGQEYHFNLTLNTNLLANSFVVEYWGSHGTVQKAERRGTVTTQASARDQGIPTPP